MGEVRTEFPRPRSDLTSLAGCILNYHLEPEKTLAQGCMSHPHPRYTHIQLQHTTPHEYPEAQPAREAVLSDFFLLSP